ncbi:hypothetical protein MBLNU459_g5805t1 [Dothideomycetes sp. NU459]
MSSLSTDSNLASDPSAPSTRQILSDHPGRDFAASIIDDHWSGSSHNDISMKDLTPSSISNNRPSLTPDMKAIKGSGQKTKKTLDLEWCNHWLIELTSLAIASCIMAAIVVILYHYKGKPISTTPSRPSLNTIVNILSTALSALIMLATTAVLSQSKWTWYQKPRRMADLQAIDAASRGPRGAIALFVRPHIGITALSGALIVLSTIAIGPMLQETIRIKIISIPNPLRNATAPIAQSYTPVESIVGNGDAVLDLPMKAAILDGLLSPSGNNSAVTLDCPTGNCTFSIPYTSLGVCHVCEPQKLDRVCYSYLNTYGDSVGAPGTACNYTLPNGHMLNYNGGNDGAVINVTTLAYGNWSDDSWAPAIDAGSKVWWPGGELNFARISLISLTNGPNCTNGGNPESDCRPPSLSQNTTDAGMIGAHCGLYLCIKSFVANITENVVNEEMIAITPTVGQNMTQILYPDWALVADPCFINGTAYTFSEMVHLSSSLFDMRTPVEGSGVYVPAQCIHDVSYYATQALIDWVTDNTSLLDGIGTAVFGMAEGAWVFTPPNLGVEPLFNKGNSSYEYIDAAFDKLATAMTNQIRQNGDPVNATAAPGILLQLQTVVVIEWAWLLLPAIVLALSCIYLALAVVQDATTETEAKSWKWKSDPLALLALGLKSRTVDLLDPLSSEAAMKKAAKQVRMRLVRVEGGWAFVEELSPDTASEHEGLRDGTT